MHYLYLFFFFLVIKSFKRFSKAEDCTTTNSSNSLSTVLFAAISNTVVACTVVACALSNLL